MPSYPTVNLEGPPEAPRGVPKPEPSPVVSYRAHRDAWASDGPCSVCGVPCSTFADAVHEDGSITGWVRVCETCSPRPKSAKAPGKAAPERAGADAIPQAAPETAEPPAAN